MNTAEVESLFRSLPSVPGFTTEIGRRRDAAYLRMADESEQGRWAVVATPGDRWVFIEVNGGFSLDRFDEDIEDDELRALIAQFVEIGVAYLNGTTSGGTLNGRAFPVLTVATDRGSFELRRSLARDLRELFRFPRRRSEEG
jgi:hypothetical protein